MGIFEKVGSFFRKYNKDPLLKQQTKDIFKSTSYGSGEAQKANEAAAAAKLEKDAAAQAAAATAGIEAEAIANQKKRVGVMYTYNPTGGQGDQSKANIRRATLGA